MKSEKNWLVALLLCIFLGALGVHRFYVGKIGTGLLQIFTLGGCGIWVFIDFIMILVGSFKDKDGNGKRRWWYHLGSSVNERSVNYSKFVTATKTGYTDESGYTMVFIMKHNGETYILVTMQAKSGQTFPTMRLVEEKAFK